MSANEDQNRRGRDRVPTDIGLTCRVPARPTPTRILDVSHYGCRIDLPGYIAEPGASIVFEMPTGERMNGEVRWSDDVNAGVRFAHALRPATARSLGLEDNRDAVRTPVPATEPTREADGSLLRHWYRKRSEGRA